MNNPKWTIGAIAYMCGFAYVISMIVYQIGGLITGIAPFSIWTIIAAALLILLLYLLFRKGEEPDYQAHSLTSVSAHTEAATAVSCSGIGGCSGCAGCGGSKKRR